MGSDILQNFAECLHLAGLEVEEIQADGLKGHGEKMAHTKPILMIRPASGGKTGAQAKMAHGQRQAKRRWMPENVRHCKSELQRPGQTQKPNRKVAGKLAQGLPLLSGNMGFPQMLGIHISRTRLSRQLH